jgi:hypothetical protein
MPLNSLSVTRFPNGVVNQAENSIFGGALPFPVNLGYHQFNDEFFEFTAAQWTVTETQAGATQAIANPGNGGIIALVNTAADDDLNAIQRVAAGITGEAWLLDPAKKFWARFVIGVSEDTQVDFIAGLQITDTTPLAVSDGFFFRKSDGSTTINLVACKNATEATLAVGTALVGTLPASGLLTNAMTLDFFWDGQGVTDGRLYGALNNVVAGYMNPGSASFCDDEALTLSFAVQNGDANARSMWIDRALLIQEM